MKPDDLIEHHLKIAQSGCTIVGRPISIPNEELARIGHYYDYRKLSAKCGQPLNPLEKLAMRFIQMHADDLRMTRLWRGLRDSKDKVSK